MNRSVRMLILTLLCSAFVCPSAAQAGACCAGSTSTIPVRLGECERWLVGLGVSGEQSLGFWDAEGAVHASSMQDQALITTVAGAWRWNRSGQVAVSLPMRLNYRAAGDLVDAGGGVGDLVLGTMLSPFEEGTPLAGALTLPRLYLTLGARVPTGRSVETSQSVLMADVTGQPGLSALGGVSIERALGRWPWGLSLDADLPVGVALAPRLSLGASLGRYIGLHWSLLASLRTQLVPGTTDTLPSRSTKVGLRVVRGQRLAWRGWVGAEAELPLEQAGASAFLTASLGAGLTVLR